MSKLRINYSQVMRKADKIENLSRDIRKEIDRISNLEDSIKSGWKGKASDSFLRKLAESKMELEKTRRSMEELSEIIKKTAKSIKEKDERDAKMAKQL